MPRKVAVLGAGVAGLQAARILADAGHRVTVIDRSERCGGAHRSRNIGDYTFDVGSIFYEDEARIFGLAPGLREACPCTKRVQKRIIDGTLRRYPIDMPDLLEWPAPKLARALFDMVRDRARQQRDGTLGAICRKRLGATFFNATGLAAYIARFNHRSADDLDEEFFFRRMQFVEEATRLRRLPRAALKVFARGGRMPPSKRPMRLRPRAGFEALFGPIRDDLSARGVSFALGETVRRIARQGEGYVIEGDGAPRRFDAVVSTLPLEVLHQALFGQGAGLPSLDMLSLYVSAAKLAPELGHVFYNFDTPGRWKRATVYSRLYPTPPEAREFFTAEVNLPLGAAADPEAAFADLAAHLTGLGLAGDLRLEGHDVVRHAYPLYLKGAGATVEAALARVAETGVITAGRQGRFAYLPTSSLVLRQVAETLAASGLTEAPGRGSGLPHAA